MGIVWCAGDPGVTEARRHSPILLTGPGEAAAHLAMLVAQRFVHLTPVETAAKRTRERIDKLGFSGRLASVRPIGIPVLQLRQDPDLTVTRITELGREAIEQDGAEALVLGCMALFHSGNQVEQALGIPVVEPSLAAAALAAMLAKRQARGDPVDPSTLSND